MSEINPDWLKPENEHYLRLAYASAYRKWLKAQKLSASEETWLRFRACHYGRFAEGKCLGNVPEMQPDGSYKPCGHKRAV